MGDAHVERVKRACLQSCSPDARGGVRFLGPKKRRFSNRLTVENLEGVDMGKLCASVSPAVVFLRQTAAADLTTASRIDVYIPAGAAKHLCVMYRMLFAASAACGLLALAANRGAFS